ncbi:MAG: cupin domain-containing protein [Patescibacteria group bacterium]
MAGYVTNIEQKTLENEYFRQVLFTAKHMQVVVMAIKPSEDIGEEAHHLDQFIRIEKGDGKAILNGEEHSLKDGSIVVIPAGTKHNIINTGSSDLKLYTIYAPPEHKDGTIHKTKADALENEEHFDGQTS